jgi:hypothetical protein
MVSQSEQEPLNSTMDTLLSPPQIPIFYLHPGAHPFCSQPGCICMKDTKKLERFLHAIINRELKLRQVENGGVAWEVPRGS